MSQGEILNTLRAVERSLQMIEEKAILCGWCWAIALRCSFKFQAPAKFRAPDTHHVPGLRELTSDKERRKIRLIF